ncbi:helix-turn-helix transcriptional regulator [Telluribacter sp. SYSU D00476]|uniref:helix-turn-helix transcriptional regulator n=1 Tax=Telluribacter sp. SYSU D00476 TaxID=2811430 RepID=UPI001FF53CE0|nr:AraC family transcriptional regulator [Telluribacter sp. SYSU D00476]
MKVAVQVSGTECWLCHQNIGDPQSEVSGLVETCNTVNLADGSQIVDEQTQAGPFLICQVDFQLKDQVRLEKQVEGEGVQLHFLLEGGGMIEAKGQTDERQFSPNQHTICYQPNSQRTFDCHTSAQTLNYFTIWIPREVYFHLIAPDSALHQSFAQGIQAGQCTYMTPQNMPITPAMRRVISEIQHCDRCGDLKKLFIESKVIELLMLQIEQINATALQRSTSKGSDWQKIEEAKRILEETYQSPPTITELARMIGLNEFRLKKDFKEQVGNTIYGFVLQQRMELARNWLLEQEKSIGEIAHLVGYRNHAHFTAAFKKYFKYLPSELH